MLIMNPNINLNINYQIYKVLDILSYLGTHVFEYCIFVKLLKTFIVGV
jgi:hypothetical protein